MSNPRLKKIIFASIWLIASFSTSAFATTCYVDASKGLDSNPGTMDLPLKTISAGVSKAIGGDTVWIFSGTYRETINLVHGGSGPTAPLVIRSMPDADVQVKGSDLVSGWALHTGSIWKRTNWDINSQQVFVDGTPLKQIGVTCPYNSIAWGTSVLLSPVGAGVSSMVPGTFFYDQGAQTLYAWLPDESDPNKHVVEASTRNWIISTDQNYVELNGIKFSHSNVTSIPYMMGMVNISGNGWLIANCSFTYADFVGLSISGYGHRLLGNIANYNGNLGITISGSDAAHGWNIYLDRPPQDILLYGNETSYNNYRNFENGWQSGGIKAAMSCNGITITRHRSVSNNGVGIWFDLYSKNNRIERSFVSKNLVGIGYEISDSAVIMSNLVTENTYQGIFVAASSEVYVLNNTMYKNGYSVVLHGMPRPEHPFLQNNAVLNNIISGSLYADLILFKDQSIATGNISDFNLFDGNIKITLTPDAGYYPNYTSLATLVKDTGQEAHSLNASPLFKNTTALDFSISAGSPAIDTGLNLVTGINDMDLAGNPRIADGKNTGKPVIDMGAYENVMVQKPANMRVVN